MTIDQLKALADDGFEIGVHTASHAHLATTSEAEQIAELGGCRDALGTWLGRPVTTVAYPWGLPGRDYTRETIVIAERLGFDFGFTTRSEFARPDEAPLERSRFVVLASVQPAELAHRITYSWR
jgi:peptidoglycan/xylan/chitin deacetylase (PgdA/CDA1 family)